ncbi:MAG: STAS domain-containing protein [Sedimenticola sp.]
MESALTPRAGGCLVSGDLLFSTARRLLDESSPVMSGESLVFDLSGVRHSDSAGLALLLEWQHRAEVAGGRISYINIPDALLRIARLSNVEGLLVGDL